MKCVRPDMMGKVPQTGAIPPLWRNSRVAGVTRHRMAAAPGNASAISRFQPLDLGWRVICLPPAILPDSPRSTVCYPSPSFRPAAHDHAAFARRGTEGRTRCELGFAAAADSTILARALDHAQIVITLDADFHVQLALSGAAGPSVIRIRIEGLKARQLADLLVRLLKQCGGDLKSGAIATVIESSVRIRHLPLIRL